MPRRTKRKIDRRIFRRTSVDRRKINVNPIIPRGGICL